MTIEQESKITDIQNRIQWLIQDLHKDLGEAIKGTAYGSVEGVAFQISELAKAHGHISAAAFRKP